jgi:hypothetical protein
MNLDQDQDYTWIRWVRDALSAGELVEPPDWVRQRAHQVFQSCEPRPAPTLIECVRASLVFDSRRSGMAEAGVRAGTVLDGPWQLLYRGGDVNIDLLVRPNQDGRTMNVRGQALALGSAAIDAGSVEALPADVPRPLRGAADPSARSNLGQSGEFALANLERGRYDVLVRFGAREIELNDLEL